MPLVTCNHLWPDSTDSDDISDTTPSLTERDMNCPWCSYLPERHRCFLRVQLGFMDTWDEVMREMKCYCQLRKFSKRTRHLLPANLDVDLNPSAGQFPLDYSDYCPCVLEGRIREECRSGCQRDKRRAAQFPERFDSNGKKKGRISARHSSSEEGEEEDEGSFTSTPHSCKGLWRTDSDSFRNPTGCDWR